MRLLKSILYLSLSLALLSVATCLCLTILDGRALLKAQFGVAQREGEKTRDLADRHARQLEQDLRLRLDAALIEVKALHGTADAQLTALRAETLGVVKESLTTADSRLASIQAEIEPVLEQLEPVLINAASIEAHTDKTVVDLHPQLLGLVAASKVTMGQTALTMREVERATPALLQDVQGIGKSADGIASDVHTATTDFVRPKTRWQKFKAVLETAGKIGARLL